jgi:hypothetical protein
LSKGRLAPTGSTLRVKADGAQGPWSVSRRTPLPASPVVIKGLAAAAWAALAPQMAPVAPGVSREAYGGTSRSASVSPNQGRASPTPTRRSCKGTAWRPLRCGVSRETCPLGGAWPPSAVPPPRISSSGFLPPPDFPWPAAGQRQPPHLAYSALDVAYLGCLPAAQPQEELAPRL